jgi:hypothetical protein
MCNPEAGKLQALSACPSMREMASKANNPGINPKNKICGLVKESQSVPQASYSKAIAKLKHRN